MEQICITPLLLVTITEPARLNTNYPFTKFGRCKYSRNYPNESVLRLSNGYSKTTLRQPQGEKEIVARTADESRNHLEATSVQVEACVDNTVRYSA